MSRIPLQTAILLFASLALCSRGLAKTKAIFSSISTGGHTVYHLRPATLAAGQRGIVAAAYDGAVLAFTPQGKQLWIAKPGNDFPYDLCVADIDGDQREHCASLTSNTAD